MPDWIITQGAELQPIFAQFSDSSGALDLPYGTEVMFQGIPMFQTQPDGTSGGLPTIGGGGVVVRPGATPDDPNRGYVRYDPSDADIAHVGLYKVIWYVLPPNQIRPQAFPKDTFMTLQIKEGLT